MGRLAGAIADTKAATKKTCLLVQRINEGVDKGVLDEDDVAAFNTALDDMNVSAPALARALSSVGVQIIHQRINEHRRRSCACTRQEGA